MTQEKTVDDYASYVGKRVQKTRPGREPKPFKSGLKVNTVRGVIEHPILQVPAFVFEEDDSYVACRACELAETEVDTGVR